MEYKKLVNNKNDLLLITSAIVVCFTFSFGIGSYALIKVYKLENQIEVLKSSCDSLNQDIKSLKKYVDFEDDNFKYELDDQSFEDYNEYGSYENSHEDNYGKLFNDLLTKMALERTKRDIVGTTKDGIPVNSEPYADIKRRNKTSEPIRIISKLKSNSDGYPPILKIENHFSGSGFDGASTSNDNRMLWQYEAMGKKSTSSPAHIFTRKSRVMHFEDPTKAYRRKILKPNTKSSDSIYQQSLTSAERTLIRTHRNRRRPRQRQIGSSAYSRIRPSIHLHGSTDTGSTRRHHHDGHFKHWSHGDWFQSLGMDQYFQLDNGHLHFTEPGLYFVYAQIFYVDQHDVNGFKVYKNDTVILQCTTSSHSTNEQNVPNTCFTAGVEYFNKGDKLKVHDMVSYRYSVFDKGTSFFGAFKIGHGT